MTIQSKTKKVLTLPQLEKRVRFHKRSLRILAFLGSVKLHERVLLELRFRELELAMLQRRLARRVTGIVHGD